MVQYYLTVRIELPKAVNGAVETDQVDLPSTTLTESMHEHEGRIDSLSA